MHALYKSQLTSLPLLNQGKVRDLYDLDDQHLLIVTTDRISAFDVVLPTPIPGKGKLLTEMARFWMHQTESLLPNQLAEDVLLADHLTHDELAQLDGRAMVVRKLKPIPVEAIVRGYLVGSGWQAYQQTGQVCGHTLAQGLQLAQKLPAPLFTPSTKAGVGEHDENIDFQAVVDLIGQKKAEAIRDLSLKLYHFAADYAEARGILIADTKFEFGEDANGRIHLIDEALTPDSSRFWPASTYTLGKNPPSFDKQYIRDYLLSLDWDKTDPGPALPPEVVEKTLEKYQEAEARLMDNA